MFGFFGVGPSGLAFFACCVPGVQRKMFGFGLLLPGSRGIIRIFVRVFGLHTRETCLAVWSDRQGKAFGLRVLQTIVRVSVVRSYMHIGFWQKCSGFGPLAWLFSLV